MANYIIPFDIAQIPKPNISDQMLKKKSNTIITINKKPSKKH